VDCRGQRSPAADTHTATQIEEAQRSITRDFSTLVKHDLTDLEKLAWQVAMHRFGGSPLWNVLRDHMRRLTAEALGFDESTDGDVETFVEKQPPAKLDDQAAQRLIHLLEQPPEKKHKALTPLLTAKVNRMDRHNWKFTDERTAAT
jgi:hypothetical protein